MRAILFDFGYTLFAHEPGPQVVRREAAALGVTLTAEAAALVWSDIDAAAMTPAELARGRDLDAAVWQSRWRAIYATRDEQVRGLGAALDHSFHDPLAWIPYADSREALVAARAAGLRVGVASNTGWDIRAVFTAHDMISLVDSFTLSYECGAVKPQPEFFRAACAAVGVALADTAIIGDDPTTDGRARDAGLAAVALVDAATPIGAPHGLTGAVASLLGLSP